MIEIHDADVTLALKNAGWREDYVFDPTETVEFFEKDGWHVFEAAREFISSFFGLGVIKGGRSVYFNSRMPSRGRLEITYWERKHGVELCPIGLIHSLHTIYIDNRGTLSFLEEEYMYVYDGDINQALRQMLFDSEESLKKEFCLNEVPDF